MASRFLRADWHRACRVARPRRSVGGGSAVSREARIGDDPLASALRTNSGGGLTFASPGQYSTSEKQLLRRACSTLAGNSGGSADALWRLSSSSISNNNTRRFGSVNSVTAGLRNDGCRRGGWKGGLGLCSSHHHQGHQLEGRRFLSSRRGKGGSQT